MRVIGVIQARFSSRRLPGKILGELRGKTVLGYLIEGLAHCAQLDGLLIATSTDPSDDPTAAFARRSGLMCFRGPLDDVARRMLAAGEAQGADAIVRINGDSPLLDPALVDQGVALLRASPADVVSNVRPRSFPRGQSVEVVTVAALRRAVRAMSTPDEREHVTPYLYAHPEDFTLQPFSAEPPRPDVQLSVDDSADLERCAQVLALLDDAPWRAGWRGCVLAYDQAVAAATGGAAR